MSNPPKKWQASEVPNSSGSSRGGEQGHPQVKNNRKNNNLRKNIQHFQLSGFSFLFWMNSFWLFGCHKNQDRKPPKKMDFTYHHYPRSYLPPLWAPQKMRLTTSPKDHAAKARALAVDVVHLKDRLTPKDGNPANMVCSSGVRTRFGGVLGGTQNL